MSSSSGKNFGKAIKYWIVTLLILFFLFEMVSAMIFSRKYAVGSLASVYLVERFMYTHPDLDLYHKMHELVRPDSSPAVCRQIADQTWTANRYGYEPWLQFKVLDHSSRYVNIKGFERKCIPDQYINRKSKDTIDIFFLGGSTMYGYNVSDAETIPSQFLRMYQSQYPNGQSVRIRNFGIPYYYSKQELLLLSKLIFEGNKPDIVIFMDGLNDFYPSRMLYYDYPHFSYAMEQVFNDQMYHKQKRTVVDSSDQFYIDPPKIPSKEYYGQLLDKYVNNIAHATNLAGKVGAKSYFFCQPVPFYNYPNREKDPISYKVSYDRFDYIYPALERKADSISNFVFLGNMLQHEKGLPFVDQVHYSPEFSKKIAEQMFMKVASENFKN
jgi:hypothetical protein